MGRRHAGAAILALVVLAALLLVAPALPEPESVRQFRIWAYGSHLLFFGTLCAAVALIASARPWPVRRHVAVIVAMLVLVIVLNLLEVEVASDIAKVLFGIAAGVALSRAIERPWWFVPICILVPLADAWSVLSSRGVTHAIVERAEQNRSYIDWPTIATPIAGYDYAAFGRIGIVDVLFTAVFLAAASRWQLGLARCAVLVALGFVGTSVLVFEEVASAVPALPLLCLAFLIGAAPGLWRDLRAASKG